MRSLSWGGPLSFSLFSVHGQDAISLNFPLVLSNLCDMPFTAAPSSNPRHAIHCEAPNARLYFFDGAVVRLFPAGSAPSPKGGSPMADGGSRGAADVSQQEPLTTDNLLLRGWGSLPSHPCVIASHPYTVSWIRVSGSEGVLTFAHNRTTLRKVDWAIGAAVFTGADSKIMMNRIPAPYKVWGREKRKIGMS